MNGRTAKLFSNVGCILPLFVQEEGGRKPGQRLLLHELGIRTWLVGWCNRNVDWRNKLKSISVCAK